MQLLATILHHSCIANLLGVISCTRRICDRKKKASEQIEVLDLADDLNVITPPFFKFRCPCRANNHSFYVCTLCQQTSARNGDRQGEKWRDTHTCPTSSSDDHQEQDPTNYGQAILDEEHYYEGVEETTTNELIIDWHSIYGFHNKDDRYLSYFRREHNNPGTGIAAAILKSQRLRNPPEEVTKEEIKFHIEFLDMCWDTPRSLLQRFATHLDIISKFMVEEQQKKIRVEINKKVQQFTKDYFENNNLPWDDAFSESLEETIIITDIEPSIFLHTAPPLNFDEIRTRYVNGALSLSENLPWPVIHETPGKTHAYVSLVEVMALYYATGKY